MSAGRLCLTPINDIDTLPEPTNEWLPVTGCAEWDGLVALESVIAKRKVKLMFTLYPPQYGEFTITEPDGSIFASGTPSVIERPTIPGTDCSVPHDELRVGRYVLRCECDTGVNYRLDVEISDWHSID